ncbi:hypothetical protein BKA83DRAFT_4491897 [Pisolithus microcarpus]|nr:hypothetical protein BKA83DRAFT_4491897 [Pisolithus microcarpus]
MLATPSPPRLNARHAITEISITPLCQKTSSIPTDGKDFRAETLDLELVTELRDAMITEALGTRFVAYWSRLSHLEIKDIKASNLVDADTDWAQNAGSSSQSTFAVQSRSSSSRKCFRGSHRWEAVAWAVPGTNTEEFIDAMLFPVASNEETMVANWLNSIIDSFSPPSAVSGNDSSPAGWRPLTQSMQCELAARCHLHSWSAEYATKPVENSHIAVKPDIVFCSQPDLNSGFAWSHVISFLELTSVQYTKHLECNITHKAYAMFTAQPARRFVVAISLTCQQYHLHIFDCSGAIHSSAHGIHRHADTFSHLLYILAFGNPQHLGFDPTFLNPALSPSPLYHPITDTALKVAWTIKVKNHLYAILGCIFTSNVIRGRATSSWHVRNTHGVHFVIKDYWTHRGRRHTEEEMLNKIKGLKGVPTLDAAWTVQIDGNDETTALLQPASIFGNASFETHIH